MSDPALLGEICDVIAGQSPAGSSYNKVGEGLPFYQGKKEFTDRFIGPPTTWTTSVTKTAQSGDVLMSVRAPVGPVNVATQEICIGRGLAAIRAGERVDEAYLFYSLKALGRSIGGNAGAVFPSIGKKQIESLRISLPSLSEQRRLVARLDELMDLVDRQLEVTTSRREALISLRERVLEEGLRPHE